MVIRTQIPEIVETLPRRLVNFFARYPPQQHSASVRRPAPTPKGETALSDEPLPSPYTPDREAKGTQGLKPNQWTPSRALLVTSAKLRNPFLPIKRNGQWQAPLYGLRQQADLMKLAIKYNVEAMLPPSRKSPEFKERRRQERGLQVKGTGIGQKVKGHKWERTMETRLDDRRKAMEGMPELVRTWKQVSFALGLYSTPLTRQNREVTVVDGSNGPRNNGYATMLHEAVSCSFDFSSTSSSRLFNASLELFSEPRRRQYLYEPQQELRMEFCFSSVLSAYPVQYNLRSHTRMSAKRYLHHIESVFLALGKKLAWN
jgi:large subunit ribosomal protein L25